VNAQAPELSVVLVTVDGFATLHDVLSKLDDQTARERMEVLVVGPASDNERPPEGVEVRRVETGRVGSWGEGAAEGVRRSNAAVVVFAEEHGFPHPGWAEAHLDGHSGPYAAVGSTLRNANPNSAVSWAHFVVAFGDYAYPVTTHEAPSTPWHHSSYKRDVLLALGDDLGAMLDAEGRLHEEMVSQGHRLLRHGNAVTDHVQVSRPASYLHAEFNGGHLLGGTRAMRWSGARRAAYALAAPAILLLRLWRARGQLARVRAANAVPRTTGPWLAAGVAASVAGEVTGYCIGLGRARGGRLDMEVHRDNHRGRERWQGA
jgi:hypothetical protein